MRMSPGEKIFQAVNYLILALIGMMAIYPFVYMVVLSVSTAAEAARGGLNLYPRDITLTAYRMVFGNPEILTGYFNTILRTVFGTIATLIMTCLCAYPLSRAHMPHRKALTFLVIFTMLFSGGIVPTYLLIKGIGLIDNRLVYILPVMLTGFNVIVVKNFFERVPNSMAEAARIDGASEFRVLFQIFIPLSKPVLATVGLWTAVLHWNMWLDAMLYITSNSKQVMQTFLQRIVIDDSVEMIEKGIPNPDLLAYTPDTIKAATVVITILPMLLLYPFLQRYFIKGIQLGGVKE
ncbi:MAG: carbohydrate ABC transporter permease [Gammaproteobacteria bacterium]|nr:MAG: carbohydrate ABC transporter permease [Gammaproteobacteria bacterium]